MSRFNTISEVSIPELVSWLGTRKWLIPQFQREFVWSVEDCEEFASSVLAGRPIGMVTVWEQSSDSQLVLEPVSVGEGERVCTLDGGGASEPTVKYAILDGRQRSQAVAMVFAGLRPKSGRFAGRFLADVSEDFDRPRVVFLKNAELSRRGIGTDESAIAQGLVPLDFLRTQAGFAPGEMPLLFRCIDVLTKQAALAAGNGLSAEEVELRRNRLSRMVNHFTHARLAVYQVASAYSLGEICEIFEKLNTTGTKVSSVDLIHSWLYGQTQGLPQPLELRDWVKQAGESHGLVDWLSPRERPELAVQFVAACFLAEPKATRPKPRPISARYDFGDSIKANDLLALPTEHWQAVVAHTKEFAGFLIDFQHCVGGGVGRFGYLQCPYPSVAGIYVGLRWRLLRSADAPWGKPDLDRLFRAFFWRNALSRRYDQGMLAKYSEDLQVLIEILEARGSFSNVAAWEADADRRLDAMRGLRTASRNDLESMVQEAAYGALKLALLLPAVAGCRHDFITGDPFALSADAVEMHHVFPRSWCMRNRTGALRTHLGDEKRPERIDAPVNLMPLSRKSNSDWKDVNPAQVIVSAGIDYATRKVACDPAMIDSQAFGYLKSEEPLEFWKHRARALAADLEARMRFGGNP